MLVVNTKKIKSVEFIGNLQTYDLEVDHPNHQFYLENDILTSNSHAYFYSMISYHTAWLKANYPLEFLLANLEEELKSNNPDAEINKAKIKEEIKNYKITILKPSLNNSEYNYKIIGENELLTGFKAIKNLGDDAIDEILKHRPFNSLIDFLVRVDRKKMRSNSIQALAACGCFDQFLTKTLTRKNIFLYASELKKKVGSWLKANAEFVGQIPENEISFPLIEDDWNISEKYAIEMHYMGEAFCCKPYKAYGPFFLDNKYTNIKTIRKAPDKAKIKCVKGIVKDFFEFKIKKSDSKNFGKTMLKLSIEDPNQDMISVTIFSDQLEILYRLLKKKNIEKLDVGMAISFEASVNLFNDEIGVLAHDFYDINGSPEMPERKSKKFPSTRKKKLISTTAESLLQELEDTLDLEE